MQKNANFICQLYSHTATQPDDYGEVSMTLIFGTSNVMGNTVSTSIPIVLDSILEGDEEFTVTTTVPGTTLNTTVTITDGLYKCS